MQKLTRSLLFAGAVLGLAACGDDVSVTPPTPPQPAVITGVTVSPAAVTISIGEKVVLSASVAVTQGTNPPPTTVAWSSANGTIATVSATGEVTGVAAGTTTILATATGDATKRGAAAVTVVSGVISVSLAPQTANLSVGGTLQAVANVQRTNTAISGAVTWSTSAANVATVSATGLITGVAVGTAIITATSTADPTKSSSLSLTVVNVPPNLTALSVSPTAAGLGIGGTVQIVPNATTVGNPTVTYTYASSNTAVATVNATGLVTAVSNGTAVITTTATTSTNSLSASTTITVASAAVSIQSITQGGLNNPVNLANVGGQFEVTLNITAGNQSLDSVRVKLGGTSAATQTFPLGGAPTAPVTLSINSAAYSLNADSTATVRFPNGVTTVQAEVFPTGATGPSASNTIQITLNNADTFHARWTLPANSATSAGGFIWYGGPNTTTVVNVIPVMYSGNTVSQATIALDDAGVDGVASICNTAVVDLAAPFVASFSCAGVVNFNVQPTVLASVRADGNAGPAGVVAVDPIVTPTDIVTTPFANAAAITPVRIDVVGPVVPTPDLTPDVAGQILGWVNAVHTFFVTGGATDLGVGLRATSDRNYEYHGCPYVSTTPPSWVLFDGTGNTIPECATDFTGGATPGPYIARSVETDRLGNVGASVPSARFGVDKTNPSIRFNTAVTPADSSVAATAMNFQIEALDDRAGLSASTAYQYRLATASGAAPVGACVTPSVTPVGPLFITAPACDFVAGTLPGVALPDGFVQAPILTTTNTAGYYSYDAHVVDQAGNSSGQLSRRVAVDPAAPLVTGLNVPPLVSAASSPAFSVTFTDDVEGIGYNFALRYPGASSTFFRYPRTTVNARFDNLISTPGQFFFTSPTGLPFARRIEAVAAADSTVQPKVTTDPTAKPDFVNAAVHDVLGTFSISNQVAILPGGVETGLAFADWNAGNPTLAVTKWQVMPLAAAFNAGAGLKATVLSPSNSTNSPFVRVDFYRQQGVGAEYYYLGSSTAAIPANNVTTRAWTYLAPTTFVISPFGATQPAAAAGNVIIAVGVTSNGDGIATVPSTVIP